MTHWENLIVKKGQAGAKGKKIMLAAHIDEIGVMATHIDEHGFVRFTGVGYVHALNCMARTRALFKRRCRRDLR